MNNTIKLKYVSLEELILDDENPRFGKLYNGGKSESDLIEYLLYNEAAEEVANAIYKAKKFYEDKALWVLEKEGKYIVKDGNRRCASLKALSQPVKYGLKFDKFVLQNIPVYVYNDEDELNKRISEEHAGNLFRKWERIAKAIEIYRLHKLNDEDSVKSLDSKPGDLIKLASFYEEASKISGEDLNLLLRRGKGKAGGKTIIFERMFKYRKLCGYDFKNAPNYSFKSISNKRFEDYIKSIVELLKQKGDEITTDTIDKNFSEFKKSLKEFGFNIDASYIEEDLSANSASANNASANSTSANSTSANSTSANSTSANSTSANSTSANSTSANSTPANSTPANSTSANSTTANSTTANSASANSASANSASANSASANSASANNTFANSLNSSRYSKQSRPKPKRKGIKNKIIKLINECYNLDENINPNAKLALSRVTFECILKYVVEETKKSNGKLIKDSKNIRDAYFDKNSKPKKYVDFDVMKNKFTNSIKDSKIKNAFISFDLNLPHQIIHNYLVEATPQQALSTCHNLIPLIDFMLQEEVDLINCIDESLL